MDRRLTSSLFRLAAAVRAAARTDNGVLVLAPERQIRQAKRVPVPHHWVALLREGCAEEAAAVREAVCSAEGIGRRCPWWVVVAGGGVCAAEAWRLRAPSRSALADMTGPLTAARGATAGAKESDDEVRASILLGRSQCFIWASRTLVAVNSWAGGERAGAQAGFRRSDLKKRCRSLGEGGAEGFVSVSSHIHISIFYPLRCETDDFCLVSGDGAWRTDGIQS